MPRSPAAPKAGSIPCWKLPHFATPEPMPDSSFPDSKRPFRLGVGRPVGSGKTMCVLRRSPWLKDEKSLAVITNDIYSREQAGSRQRGGVLGAVRVSQVVAGGGRRMQMRDDTSIDMAAVIGLECARPD